jgi:hypothetical protein
MAVIKDRVRGVPQNFPRDQFVRLSQRPRCLVKTAISPKAAAMVTHGSK